MTNYYRISPRRNTSRRSGRQNFKNKNVSPRRSAIRKNSSRRSGRQNFSNCNGSPVEEEEQFKNRKRSQNRRSARQNFRNKRVGKERLMNWNWKRDKIVIIASIILLSIAFGLFVRLAIVGRKKGDTTQGDTTLTAITPGEYN